MKLSRLLNGIPTEYNRARFVDLLSALVRQVDDLSEGRASAYHGVMDAPPTSGDWVRGDWVKNRLPSATGMFGWICVDSGTPGTWKGFGQIVP